VFSNYCKSFQKRFERKPLATFDFEDFIPKPYRRDHKPFLKRLERKTIDESKTSCRRDQPAQLAAQVFFEKT